MDHRHSHPYSHLTGLSAQAPLTEKEREVYQMLSQAQHEGVFGECISYALETKQPSVFRKLIKMLKDQLDVAPMAMHRILTQEIAQAVRTL